LEGRCLEVATIWVNSSTNSNSVWEAPAALEATVVAALLEAAVGVDVVVVVVVAMAALGLSKAMVLGRQECQQVGSSSSSSSSIKHLASRASIVQL